MPNPKEIVAIFDIDNTLLPGYSIIDFAKFLTEKGLFKTESWNKTLQFIGQYRSKEITYNEFADLVVEEYGHGIQGQNVESIRKLSSEFWTERIKTLFPFVQALFQFLRENEAKIIAISGSSLESLLPLTQLLGFDQLITTEVAANDEGYFTDQIRVNAASHKQKTEIISSIFAEINPEVYTLGFGDSDADLAFLNLVTQAIVIGQRDEELTRVATENNWQIVHDPVNTNEIVLSDL